MDAPPPGPPARRAALGGRFWLDERLASDAAGELHRALDLRSGGPALVRIVRSEGSGRVERLLRDTKRAAAVKHEGLAVVLGVGKTEEGDVFVALETSKGERLSERLLGRAAFDVREAGAIAQQIARALEAAHDAGVMHRELRPSVIVLTREGEATRVKVEGLGMPRSPSATPREDDPEGAYAAPEQRRGETVGRRADVYSIGAMLHAMLAGGPPTGGSALGGPLGDIVKRCLADDPRERFLDTIALGAALRTAMAALPSRADGALPSRVGAASESVAPDARDPSPERAAPASSPPPASAPLPVSSPPPASVPLPVSSPPPASVPLPASSPPRASVPPRASSPPPAQLATPSARPPAAPPPRLLTRPLTTQPPWKQLLLDAFAGPAPRVVLVVVVVFILARLITSGALPFLAGSVAGVAAYLASRRGSPRAGPDA